MNTVTDLSDWVSFKNQNKNKSLGFIPTMGHLHAGHLSLCKQSQEENDLTVVSIFVNPTQFNDTTDFTLYPRTIEHDKTLLLEQKIDCLFLPNEQSLYPDGYEIKIKEELLSQILEGRVRKGHFEGMLTIVLKLFNIIQPNRAYFGEKDFQQLLLIKKMV